MPHTRLYVGDLAASVTEQDLIDLFSQVGIVKQVSLVSRPPQVPFAFVQMESPEQAREAIQQYNGYALEGSRLIVYSAPRHSSPHSSTIR